MPSVDAPVREIQVLYPFDIGVAGLCDQLGQDREQRLLVQVFSPGEEIFNELHVFLRHRRDSKR